MKARRTALALLAILAVSIVGVLAAARVGSRLVRSVLHPVPLPAGFAAERVSLPGLEHAIAGWWLDRGEDSSVVLLLHGLRADRASMVSRARLLSQHGFSVLAIDLQGHGETPGAQITFGARESGDVQAARAWLERRAPGRRLGALGCSLGGAAVLLGPQPAGFDAVVLEAVYPRLSTAVTNRIRLRVGGLAPFLTPLLLVQLGPRLHVSPSDLEPIRGIGRLGCPVLVVAGAQDRHTTLAESQELFRAAAQPKRLWVVPGAAHEDFLAAQPERYVQEVVGFLRDFLVLLPDDQRYPTAIAQWR